MSSRPEWDLDDIEMIEPERFEELVGYVTRGVSGKPPVFIDQHENATDIEWKVNPFK